VFIILGYKDLTALTVMEILIFGLAAVLLCTVVSAYPAQSLDRHDKNCTVTGNGVRVFVLSDITNEPDDTMCLLFECLPILSVHRGRSSGNYILVAQ
jgi:hypothetical protein